MVAPGAALVFGLVLALGQAQPGLAHAHVTTASPAPDAVLATSPPTLALDFDSSLAPSGNQIALYRSDRSLVGSYAPPPKNGNPPSLQTGLPRLTPDVYTVAWTSVSGEDGHTLQQTYAFTVGKIPEATAPPSFPPLKVGDTRVALQASRGDVGPMVLHAVVRDASGKPLTNLQRVIFRYQPVGLDLGQDEIFAPASGSDAQTPAFTLGLAGAWQLQVIVRRAGLDDVSTTTQLTLNSAPQAEASPSPTSAAAVTPASATAAASATSAPATALAPASAPPFPTAVATTPTSVATALATALPSITIAPTPTVVVAPASSAGPSDLAIVAGVGVVVVALLAIGGRALLRR
jgi:methionine-rich copper-binding protein CopC